MVKSGNCSTGLLVRPKPENETLAASSQTGIRKPSTLANKDLAMRLISQIRKRPHVAFSILCLITALSGYAYTSTSSTAGKHVSIVFLYLSAAIGAYFCLRQLVRMTRIRFFMKKYASSYEIPSYEEMQKMVKETRVKLDKKHPFVLIMGLDNAYYDPLMGRIALGDVLLNRLEGQEGMALVSHELTHVKKKLFAKQIFLIFIL